MGKGARIERIKRLRQRERASERETNQYIDSEKVAAKTANKMAGPHRQHPDLGRTATATGQEARRAPAIYPLGELLRGGSRESSRERAGHEMTREPGSNGASQPEQQAGAAAWERMRE